MRKPFFFITAVLIALAIWLASIQSPVLWTYVVIGPILILGIWDSIQTKRAVLRNFPVLGHGRYLLEMIRPEINQYFIESDTDGRPFSRSMRSVVYQRAKKELDTRPFGTQQDVYAVGYEWINHSLNAIHASHEEPRVLVGESTCSEPYSASRLNISAMSFGSLSRNAVLAMSHGAKSGGFAHNTGEGGISPYHKEGGADLIWQVGTGYFGCRADDGTFDPEKFKATAATPAVKMIEIKLSQGAKPGHGGILPAAKLTEEISKIRGVPMGADVNSPPAHSSFSTPVELLAFVTDLREMSGGKPVGIKLCVGSESEFMSLCKAMVKTGQHPDFITVDGGEGGTGAAPLEFSDSLGMPLSEGLSFVHNCLTGFRLRQKVRIIAAGRIITGFHMVRTMALGADICYSARGMMMAVGCIQARRCNSNDCPVGVATQNADLVVGLDVGDKRARVEQFHKSTVRSMMEILGAAGMRNPSELEPAHLMRRVSNTETMTFEQIFNFIEPGSLLYDPVPEGYEDAWFRSDADVFR
jgi:glutamate synthase domain-containing protein 2